MPRERRSEPEDERDEAPVARLLRAGAFALRLGALGWARRWGVDRLGADSRRLLLRGALELGRLGTALLREGDVDLDRASLPPLRLDERVVRPRGTATEALRLSERDVREGADDRVVPWRLFERLRDTALERSLAPERVEALRSTGARLERFDRVADSVRPLRLDDLSDSVRRPERRADSVRSAAPRLRESRLDRLVERLSARSTERLRSPDIVARDDRELAAVDVRVSARLLPRVSLRLLPRSSATRSPRELLRSRSKAMRELRLLCAHSRCSARATLRWRLDSTRVEAWRALSTKRVCSTWPR